MNLNSKILKKYITAREAGGKPSNCRLFFPWSQTQRLCKVHWAAFYLGRLSAMLRPRLGVSLPQRVCFCIRSRACVGEASNVFTCRCNSCLWMCNQCLRINSFFKLLKHVLTFDIANLYGSTVNSNSRFFLLTVNWFSIHSLQYSIRSLLKSLILPFAKWIARVMRVYPEETKGKCIIKCTIAQSKQSRGNKHVTFWLRHSRPGGFVLEMSDQASPRAGLP